METDLLQPAAEMYESVPCPVCQHGRSRVWMANHPVARYLRCPDCGTVYASPRLISTILRLDIERSYPASPGLERLTEGRRPALQQEAEIVQRDQRGGRLLDVGCSSGAFFEFFPAPAWERYGVELSPSAAAYAAQNYAAQVFPGTLLEASYPAGFFDLVTMIDMFYFVPNPNHDLAEARRVLKADGRLAIEIAGQAYMLARSRGPLCLLLEGRWTRLSPASTYFTWFSPSGLGRLLRANGFRVLGCYPIGSPRRAGVVGLLGRSYSWLLRQGGQRWPMLLTWSPKVLCIAQPV